MQNATATIYCPNYSCQAPNPEGHRFCQKCRTFLPRHYLWAVGHDADAYQPGEVLANRYICKSPRIFLDAKPGIVSQAPTEIPQSISAYLRLSPYRLHVPQVYGLVQADQSGADILLLEQAALFVPPLSTQAGTEATIPSLLPALTEVWQQATGLRQINWLWQIAQLWQPLTLELVGTSLLEPDLLRMEGPLIRLLELHPEHGSNPPTLPQLGHLWAGWAETAQAAIAPFLRQLCQDLIQGTIRSGEQLVDRLDEGLSLAGQHQSRQIQVATRTDQGPSRQRNEDACYPPGGTFKTITLTAGTAAPDSSLVIVCDGIGGHQGGDVASNLAIEAIWERMQPLRPESLSPAALSVEIEKAACAANDLISQRNDSEKRLDRQRMGTTLVMSLVRNHELYTAHVGDSRAYLITRWGCHQITLDDDIASREVRLGYGFYREALQQPSSGSLVQALGMGSSNSLHPTVQRFVLDEDCIFLLCSDGLSDGDRVEECWDTTILPVLDGKFDLAAVSQQLVEIANTRNGHDNVTIGLVYCRLSEQGLNIAPGALMSAVQPPRQPMPAKTVLQTGRGARIQPTQSDATTSTLKTQVLEPSKRRRPSIFPLLLGILVLLGLGGMLLALLVPSIGNRIAPLVGLGPNSEPAQPSSEPTIVSDESPEQTTAAIASLEVGSYIRVERSPSPGSLSGNEPLVLLPQLASSTADPGSAAPGGTADDFPAPPSTATGEIPSGSVLQVLSRQGASGQERWVRLRVCSVPTAEGSIGQPPEEGTADSPTASPISSSTVSPDAGNRSPVPIEPTAPAPEPATPLLQPGAEGWIQEAAIASHVQPQNGLTAAQRGECAPPTASTTRIPASPPATPIPSPAAPAGS
ncbi:protein phosphatase 2C domain-containing protein [Leptolyngbya sp. FACHB-541]|uniref:protein phosphatase 2C domain-containing protein n=1 Tax=Leptolyngbya sp. FACHB-541 TaxID=2692810 RepID=UPI0016892DCD|nr:protein phosphatase 2C domain-containing protein [Leptolyngbya sp. FACHB-541]MBD2000429.1 protein phosphatase 2C domain-containing protein [Leptolyngbya sp. FACHB-541]